VKERLHAMDLDSLATARRIRQPIESDSDIANAFDDITYEKGAAVIRMFEAWLGPEKFRAGVQRYLRRHAWGNATAADFEAALSAAAGRNIAPAFNSFLDQAGVPEVAVALDCSGPRAKLNLSQKRSLPIGSGGGTDARWLIPVCLKAGAGNEAQRQCLVLVDPATELSLPAPGCPDLLDLNDGASGYYRVAYQGALLERALADGGRRLTAPARASELGDAAALVGTGTLSPRVALSLAAGFANSMEPQVIEIATQIAAMVKEDAVPPELRPNAARFIRQTYGARAAALGWLPKPPESEDTRLVRSVLVPFAAQLGEQPELIAEARQLANRWVDDRKAIGPDMLEAVLVTAAAFGDRALFDRLHETALREQDPRVRFTLLVALGSFRDPRIERAALALLLTREFDMRQALFPLLTEPLKNPETRDLPFQFVKENLDSLLANIPREVGGDFAAALPLTGRAFCDEEHRSEVRMFFEARVKNYVGGERNLAQSLESIGLCIARRNALAPALAEFLKSY
jgi:alanyl aminopeptidase